MLNVDMVVLQRLLAKTNRFMVGGRDRLRHDALLLLHIDRAMAREGIDTMTENELNDVSRDCLIGDIGHTGLMFLNWYPFSLVLLKRLFIQYTFLTGTGPNHPCITEL